jgi:hypothetical protein
MGKSIGTLALIAIAIIWFTHGGVKSVVSVAEPQLERISATADTPFFGDPSLHQTFRNKGAGGKILLTITQSQHTWKFLVYYDRDEQREVVTKVPGLGSGNYYTAWKPADIATPEELAGAFGTQ